MGNVVSYNHRAKQRRRVAQEAAGMLYTGQEKEYKQAKLRAAKISGVHVLPSNAEVAMELDRIAEEREGKTRQQRLVQMRCEALKVMQVLRNFSPILVGSVWRGTAHRNSDIDIIIYARNQQQIILTLQRNNYPVKRTEIQTVTKKGKKGQSFHIYVDFPSNDHAEIVVRSPEDINCKVICEIYGDVVTGLTIKQLQRVLEENPKQKALPR